MLGGWVGSRGGGRAANYGQVIWIKPATNTQFRPSCQSERSSGLGKQGWAGLCPSPEHSLRLSWYSPCQGGAGSAPGQDPDPEAGAGEEGEEGRKEERIRSRGTVERWGSPAGGIRGWGGGRMAQRLGWWVPRFHQRAPTSCGERPQLLWLLASEREGWVLHSGTHSLGQPECLLWRRGRRTPGLDLNC